MREALELDGGVWLDGLGILGELCGIYNLKRMWT